MTSRETGLTDERRHFSTYYFANIVCNVLRDPFPYIRNLDGFWGSEFVTRFSEPFPKWSALHAFIEFVVTDLLFEEDGKSVGDSGKPPKLWVEYAADFYGIENIDFKTWLSEAREPSHVCCDDDVYDFYSELQVAGEEYENLISEIVDDAFSVLFSHRSLLLDLNEGISGGITDLDAPQSDPDFGHLFTPKGRLKRAHVPEWASRAVFYRDRGRCVLCDKDLTGLLSPDFSRHMDHIVALANGGINDVTNLQLLCEACNLQKLHFRSSTRDKLQPWYERP
ncbi:HNH endonuclease [Bradyrhizobium stylosanthis]|uniref:HNH endonuclease n=1 Tax=Bradyrhizobium stylosanthis TaxID=1803665 RepID=A0A560CZR3_9BRAD|nr:HNH endonuclease signature motif containing protein [Bradyrhizobium stylosanthis]TWA90359.1 HNH endonuclease [Bradyrhizobium stylosanthis]